MEVLGKSKKKNVIILTISLIWMLTCCSAPFITAHFKEKEKDVASELEQLQLQTTVNKNFLQSQPVQFLEKMYWKKHSNTQWEASLLECLKKETLSIVQVSKDKYSLRIVVIGEPTVFFTFVNEIEESLPYVTITIQSLERKDSSLYISFVASVE